jgi:cupin 2 domain-containing protein
MAKKKKRKLPGHYCHRCHRRRANERFSGKGHTKHICKSCENEKRTEAKRKCQIADSKRVATNLFHDLPTSLPDELVEVLLQTAHVRIERIVSTGQSSPKNFWYDQDEGEWVILLRGEATIEFDNEIGMRRMRCGDHVFIPAHQKHRVAATSTKTPSVWLAVFVKEKRVATKCWVKKKRPVKNKPKRAVKHPPGQPTTGQRQFDFREKN